MRSEGSIKILKYGKPRADPNFILRQNDESYIIPVNFSMEIIKFGVLFKGNIECKNGKPYYIVFDPSAAVTYKNSDPKKVWLEALNAISEKPVKLLNGLKLFGICTSEVQERCKSILERQRGYPASSSSVLSYNNNDNYDDNNNDNNDNIEYHHPQQQRRRRRRRSSSPRSLKKRAMESRRLSKAKQVQIKSEEHFEDSLNQQFENNNNNNNVTVLFDSHSRISDSSFSSLSQQNNSYDNNHEHEHEQELNEENYEEEQEINNNLNNNQILENIESIYDWTPQHVAAWFKEVDEGQFGFLSETVRIEEIDGYTLMAMTPLEIRAVMRLPFGKAYHIFSLKEELNNFNNNENEQ